MQDLLHAYYDIPTEEIIVMDNRYGNKSGKHIYFIISAANKEIIYMEQATLAYYLAENNMTNIAIPVPTSQGEWLVTYQGKRYLVLQVNEERERFSRFSSGEKLAEFHVLGAMYHYEPTAVSSYGKWRELWTEKLTMFEEQLQQQANEYPCAYHRLVMDVFPYIIGVSENAIQYVQETELDHRFDQADQGTITFNRYQDQIEKSIIWADSLVYDHPVRDLAEHVRNTFLQETDRSDDIKRFFKDYQSIRPLSVFSMRLLYARLIFPAHLFDVLERGLSRRPDYKQLHQELADLLSKQARYEQRLRNFFDDMAFDYRAHQVPVLHWL